MAGNADDHPIFGALKRNPSGALDAITERRVEKARADGLFDNLAGAGKPIPDIDVQRPSGWFANRLVTTERQNLAAVRLEETIRKAKPDLWRLATEYAVEQRVAELNELIDSHNHAKPQAPVQRLDLPKTLAMWKRLNQ